MGLADPIQMITKWYPGMVDTIRIFIRAERLADWDSHLGCIVTRMLDIYASSWHYPYAKGARLYSQMMLEYEKDPKFNDTIANYKDCGEHVVRYTDQVIMSGLAFG